jgi:hypothetical protein
LFEEESEEENERRRARIKIKLRATSDVSTFYLPMADLACSSWAAWYTPVLHFCTPKKVGNISKRWEYFEKWGKFNQSP